MYDKLNTTSLTLEEMLEEYGDNSIDLEITIPMELYKRLDKIRTETGQDLGTIISSSIGSVV